MTLSDRRIYLDHNATTPLRPEVLEAMLPYLKEIFGNPSSIHQFGQEAKTGMEEGRERVANLIHSNPSEIVFTGSGTAADNLAIKGIAYASREKGRHIITSSIEHLAVLNPCKSLEQKGYQVTYLSVDRYGMVDPDEVKSAIRPETILITIMHANNEVGTIEPIEEIGKIAGSYAIPFHTDAIQSLGKIPVDVKVLRVDLLSISAHKIYGPKGVGALYIRKGIELEPLLLGGHHEMNRRAGTENVSGIVGFGKAAELSRMELEDRLRLSSMETLRDYFLERLQQDLRYVQLNGHPVERLPNTLNVSFEFVSGESLAINLDLHGIAVSVGSACTSGAIQSSHVLQAMGVPPALAQSSLRFSLGRETTRDDIDLTVEILRDIVDRLRSGSSLYADRKTKPV
jgi:cysteine desulfurase